MIAGVLDDRRDELLDTGVAGQTTPSGSRGEGPETQRSLYRLTDGHETDSLRKGGEPQTDQSKFGVT